LAFLGGILRAESEGDLGPDVPLVKFLVTAALASMHAREAERGADASAVVATVDVAGLREVLRIAGVKLRQSSGFESLVNGTCVSGSSLESLLNTASQRQWTAEYNTRLTPAHVVKYFAARKLFEITSESEQRVREKQEQRDREARATCTVLAAVREMQNFVESGSESGESSSSSDSGSDGDDSSDDEAEAVKPAAKQSSLKPKPSASRPPAAKKVNSRGFARDSYDSQTESESSDSDIAYASSSDCDDEPVSKPAPAPKAAKPEPESSAKPVEKPKAKRDAQPSSESSSSESSGSSSDSSSSDSSSEEEAVQPTKPTPAVRGVVGKRFSKPLEEPVVVAKRAREASDDEDMSLLMALKKPKSNAQKINIADVSHYGNKRW
jgi:hypothetical protein